MSGLLQFSFAGIRPEYDAYLAALVRSSLAAHQLDIPGTAYFDDALDHLSDYYKAPGRAYFVLLSRDTPVGGVGLAPFPGLENTCEMQKLYLDEAVRGQGLGYTLVEKVEEEARKLGYRNIYLETHTNLAAAIHIYEKSGYRRIDPPESVVHSTMDHFYLKAL